MKYSGIRRERMFSHNPRNGTVICDRPCDESYYDQTRVPPVVTREPVSGKFFHPTVCRHPRRPEKSVLGGLVKRGRNLVCPKVAEAKGLEMIFLTDGRYAEVEEKIRS